MKKTFYLETLSVGCPKNILESANYREFFNQNGAQSVDRMNDADIIVFNSCGCLETLQQKVRDSVDDAIKLKDKEIIVAGCYPEIDKGNNLEELNVKTFPPGDIDALSKLVQINQESETFEKTHDLEDSDYNGQPLSIKLPSMVAEKFLSFESILSFKIYPFHNLFNALMMSNKFHYVEIGRGCMGNCTFCGIKHAIGNPKSREIDEIVEEVEIGLKSGKENVWLVSDDIGCWGMDIGKTSPELLKSILSKQNNMTLVLNYFEPEMFLKYFDEMKEILLDKRIVQICIPLQTGSQKVLKRMGRKYDIEEVIKKIEMIKRQNPELVFKSQIIVGFPGETWIDFFKTCLAIMKYDAVGVNKYARLKYTPAYKLKPLSNFTINLRNMLVLLPQLVSYGKMLFRLRLKRFK